MAEFYSLFALSAIQVDLLCYECKMTVKGAGAYLSVFLIPEIFLQTFYLSLTWRRLITLFPEKRWRTTKH